jgi:hypothetical protein
MKAVIPKVYWSQPIVDGVFGNEKFRKKYLELMKMEDSEENFDNCEKSMLEDARLALEKMISRDHN